MCQNDQDQTEWSTELILAMSQLNQMNINIYSENKFNIVEFCCKQMYALVVKSFYYGILTPGIIKFCYNPYSSQMQIFFYFLHMYCT